MLATWEESTAKMYVTSMGRTFEVLAIADTIDEANAYMEKNSKAAVFVCMGPLVILADVHESPRKML